MTVEILAPDGSSLEEWATKKRNILNTDAITDEYQIINDSNYWLTNFEITTSENLNPTFPKKVPPLSKAKITLTFNGQELFDKMITEIRTHIKCEQHVSEP